ncbi:unnamed protein product [Seminavis robusta]|uniref:Unnamed protein product n=1 Tax=Seminavis robusta TaxID=568900 RepID=A0A9N8HQ86_9STRA|nr:unnamed protein product [Seminavis robusta]|eukprot:Sro962_g225180.1 unnamed protein product (311) ;mRNA; f:32483-33415
MKFSTEQLSAALVVVLLTVVAACYLLDVDVPKKKKKKNFDGNDPSESSAATDDTPFPVAIDKDIPLMAPPRPPQFANLFTQAVNNKKQETKQLASLASFTLPHGIVLTAAQGSVVDFKSDMGAIVTPCNELLAPADGIDKAVLRAGGLNLSNDRMSLSNLANKSNQMVKCPTGRARIVGPNYKKYGELGVDNVIHAVGPDFNEYTEEKSKAMSRLRNAYRNALALTDNRGIAHVAVSLISAGKFRGLMDLESVVTVAVRAIRDWAAEPQRMQRYSTTKNIVLCASTRNDADVLVAVCDALLIGEYKIAMK